MVRLEGSSTIVESIHGSCLSIYDALRILKIRRSDLRLNTCDFQRVETIVDGRIKVDDSAALSNKAVRARHADGLCISDNCDVKSRAFALTQRAYIFAL